MPFITTPERYGMEKGMLLIIEDLLRAKFGEEGGKLMPDILALDDPEKYRAMSRAIAVATTPDEVRRACAEAAAPPPPPKKKRSKRGQP